MIVTRPTAVKAPAAPCRRWQTLGPVCTATWLLPSGGWELFVNRDEQRSRLPARAPEIQARGERRILAPVDGDAGGTWLGVNDCGVGLCLLNGKPRGDEAPAEGFTSRGLLLLDLLEAESLDEVARNLRRADLNAYRGFSVLALAPDAVPVVHVWDGLCVETIRDPELPLVSSSRDTEEARRHRSRTWQRLHADEGTPTAASLLAFHRSHEPEAGPWSVCMHRQEAHTVSLSHVRVGEGRAELAYAPGPPCRTALSPPVTMEELRPCRV